MKPNHVKIAAAAADVALATIAAAVAMAAAMVDAGPSLAGNNQHFTQCFGLRDDPIHPGDPRCCSFAITTRTRRLTVKRIANEIKRRWGRRTGEPEAAASIGPTGNWGMATFLIMRPSWLHRSALFSGVGRR